MNGSIGEWFEPLVNGSIGERHRTVSVSNDIRLSPISIVSYDFQSRIAPFAYLIILYLVLEVSNISLAQQNRCIICTQLVDAALLIAVLRVMLALPFRIGWPLCTHFASLIILHSVLWK